MRNPIIPVEQKIIKVKGEHKLDFKSICCFAAIGFFLDNDTYYEDEKVLRAASTFHNKKEEIYFKWFYDPVERKLDDIVDEFAAIFEGISNRLLDGKKIILPLSGGLDSRSQAAALVGRKDVVTYSYEFERSFNETYYGEKIAEVCDWNFKKYIIPNGYLWERLTEISKTNGCYSDFVSPRQAAISEHFPDMGDVFYLGHWGDVLFDSMHLPSDAGINAQIDCLYKKIVKKGGIELATALWQYWGLEGNFEEFLRQRLTDLLSKIDIHDANARVRAFKSLYWAPRGTSIKLSFFSRYHELALPYYDDEMCRFICSVPEKYLADRLIQIEYIKRKSHELAQIPWQTYHPRNLYNYNQKDLISELIGTANSLRRKAKELITNRFMTMRNWEIQYLGKDNESHLREAIFNDKGIAPKEVSEEFLKKFYQGNHKSKIWYSHPVSMLLILSQKCE